MELHISLVGRKNLSGEIYRQIRRAIADGRLRPGDCLPASRDLAHSLQVSRTTVTVAYDRLTSEGFLTSRIGAGTYVSNHFASGSHESRREKNEGVLRPKAVWDSVQVSHAFDKPAAFDFRTGLPDATLFPHETWRRLLNRELRVNVERAGVYEHPGGHRGLRDAIARHIGVSRGLQVSAEDVTITSGAQQALDLIARALVEPGERIAFEDPGYAPPRLLFNSLGACVYGVPVDEEGIVVDAIPRDTRVVYVTPSHQYPLGVTMSLSRRLALLDWAERNNAAIIEDDYDSEFRFEERPLEPLQTLDTSGRVVYVGSFSKTLLPTLRLGFLVTPSCCTPAVHKAKYVTDWHTATLVQAVLARFIDQGGFARHVRKVGRVYAERRALITRILMRDFAEHLTIVPSVAGLHLTALARSASVEQISAVFDCAAELGVQVQRLAKFYSEQPARAGLLFGYGAIPTTKIEEGLEKLRTCFDYE
ncbi:MAG TPA: PLP-dependent aminotransferase family protein [Pyrinomonadaceae bacterium]|jgi:GntR family transcriptional regulator/MocR family aminotransferase